MDRPAKKNISKEMFDIKPPTKKRRALPAKSLIDDLRTPRFKLDRRIIHKTKIIVLVMIPILLIYAVNIFDFKKDSINSLKFMYREKEKIQNSALKLKTGEIARSLKTADEEIKAIYSRAQNSGLLNLSYLFGAIVPNLKQIPEILQTLSSLTETSLAIAEDADYLKTNGMQLIINQKGENVITVLERLKNNLNTVKALNAEFKNQLTALKDLSPELSPMAGIIENNYIPISLNLYRATDFLNALTYLLKQPNDQHILLIFQNPSEMRPAGGFIGSFGNLVLNKGNLVEIKVDDIYNADRQLVLKSIPPRELQSITKDWGARDANWFFDFPTSAQQVIDMLEQSDLYHQKMIQFQGAIALNTNVLETLIDIIGPIELPNYNLTLNSDNFLQEIQREVEAGRDKKPGQNPKRILSVLTPILFEKLNDLSDEQKQSLITRFKNHFSEKDIMIYFKEWKLQNFLESIGAAGEILNLPKDFSGDYLAVVNANIAGGKTDAFINQRITLKSRVAPNGEVTNELSVYRTHGGENEKSWWYKMANKNYSKILVPENSILISVTGNNQSKLMPEHDYQGYEYDEDLKLLEYKTKFNKKFGVWVGEEYGKTSFGAWFNTLPGTTKILKLAYKNKQKLNLKKKLGYTFIFEKQSGANGTLEYSITAPPGYIWQESGSDVFEYSSQKIKTREIINLTLIKI